MTMREAEIIILEVLRALVDIAVWLAVGLVLGFAVGIAFGLAVRLLSMWLLQN